MLPPLVCIVGCEDLNIMMVRKCENIVIVIHVIKKDVSFFVRVWLQIMQNAK